MVAPVAGPFLASSQRNALVAPLLNIEPKSLIDLKQPANADDGGSVSELPRQLLARKIALLHANTPIGVVISTLAAILLIGLFARTVDTPILAYWGVAFAVVTSIRFLQHNRYLHDEAIDDVAWLNQYAAAMCAMGIVWGSTVLLFPTSGLQLEYMMVSVWAFGLTATSLVAFAVVPRVFFAFSVPTLTPCAIVSFMSGDPFGVTLGTGIIIYFVFVSTVAVRASGFIEAGLHLQIEKEALAADLNGEKRQVEELNQILRADVMDREQTETELRQAKDEAERLAEKLILISGLDGLTEIANRRHLDEALEREWARGAREKTPLSLILIDIDHFKPYNDRYGHQAGDECLRVVAHILEGFCRRGGDLAARYGGEEFALVLPSTNLQSAIRIAERIRSELSETKIEHQASPISPFVTASFGVTSVVAQKEGSSAILVESADKALYRAKDGGRNRVESGVPVTIIGETATE